VTLITPIFVPLPSYIAAAEENDVTVIQDEIEIIKNEKYIEFEKELVELKQKRAFSLYTLSHSNENTYNEDMFSLISKYEGAEVEVMVNATSSYQTKFVRGGVNSFARSRAGLNALRSEMNGTATSLRVFGTVGGHAFGGIVGSFLGLVASNVLANNINAGANGVSKFIQAGRYSGGARVTLTEGFPISNISTVYEATFR